jgi:hypothetical protein
MKTDHLVPAEHFCSVHEIEFSFIQSLHDLGLIEITTIDETSYLFEEQIRAIERMIHLHYELEINLQGIDAIAHLLQQLEELQKELTALRNRLRLYEEG